MRFLVDAQLPPAFAAQLRGAGHDCQHVREVGLGDAADAAIWRHACETGAILITKDQDFAAPAKSIGPATPVVLVRLGNTTNRVLWAAFEPILGELTKAIGEGEALIEIR